MYRLQEQFGEKVDFISLDMDNPTTKESRFEFGMRNRSHFVLIDAEKNILAQWFGQIEDVAMAADLEAALATLEN